MKQRIGRVICAVLAAAALAACSRNTTAGAAKRDTLRVSVPQDAKSLNPILSSTTIDSFIMRLMFEPLVSADPRGEPVAILAAQVPSRRNGGISGDGLTIIYHLRRNARWTDGQPVTSRDVKFSW